VKLRIHENSLRLRLNRSDVEQIRKTGMCSETLRLGTGSQLTYSLEASPECDVMRAEYVQDRIRVQMPLQVAQQWAASDQISLAQKADEGAGPTLLIEKDFQHL
jgi:hypothetical protein